MIRIVQPAPSPTAPVVALWLVGPQMDPAIRAALPGCAIVADVERVLRPDLAAVRRIAGTSGPIVVGGWSAGVQGPRQLMVDGAEVAGVVALDGTAANLPPAAWQIDVWRELVAEARAGRRLFVATATQQTYMEALRDDPRTPQVEAPFMATVHVLERALGLELPPGAEVHEGGLHVYSVPSARIDAEAHREQLRVWLPRVLREHVAPWLASRATTASPIVDRDLKPENVAQAPGSATTGTPATTTATPRVLTLGLEGDDVRGWQRTLAILGYEVECTSVFDAVTDRVTRAFQGAAGVGVDGKVGPKTRAAADRALARRAAVSASGQVEPTPPPERAAVPFIQARHYHPGRLAPVRVVVLHTTEGDLKPGAARAVASWFAGPQAPQASAHYVVDIDEVIGCVRESDTAWHAPGANRDGVGVEMVGRASWARERWDAADVRAMLERAARLVSEVCARHSIPAEYVGAEGLLAGSRGITTHANVSRAYRRSTHTDVGAGFPLVWFIERVAANL